MPEADQHAVDPDDEGRHAPSEDPMWNESHYLDVVSHDRRVAAYSRIGLYPNLGVAWWTAMVVGPDRPVVASVAYELPVPERGLGLRSGPHDLDAVVEAPLDRIQLRGSAPAEIHGLPVDLYRGTAGTPTSIGLDLTWTTDGVPYRYDVTTRYEIPCLVGGTITVGDELVAVEGQGQRDHSWGVRDWWAFGWCWFAGRLDDGTAGPRHGRPHPRIADGARVRPVPGGRMWPPSRRSTSPRTWTPTVSPPRHGPGSIRAASTWPSNRWRSVLSY